ACANATGHAFVETSAFSGTAARDSPLPVRFSTGRVKGMTEQEFDNTVRELTRRRPFVPFIVELHDGDKIMVTTTAVGFGGGVAGFISETDGLVGFSARDVRAFLPFVPGATQ